jgi:hypothetical protein
MSTALAVIPTARPATQYTLQLKTQGTKPTITVEQAALRLVQAYQHCVEQYLETPKLWDTDLTVDADAPESVEGLQACIDQGYLPVSPLHSETSIYGEPGNLWFRWFHDCGHLLTGCEMDYLGELKLARAQLDDVQRGIQELYPDLPPSDYGLCIALYVADSAGQSEYHEDHGHFPEDQRAFVLDVLRQWGWRV